MRRLLHLAIVALGVVACHPQVRRAAGDESPFPAIDESSLQRDVAPCQDFYQFACGGFTAGAPIPADRTRWSRAGELEERNARLLRRVLEEAEAGKVDPQERFGRKAGDYYAACMDEADVEASGLAELQAEWARLDAIGDRQDLADEVIRLEAMGFAVPFGVRAEPDPAGAGRELLVLGRRGAGLAARRAAVLDPGAEDAELEHVRELLRLGGFPAGGLEQEALAAAGLQRTLDAGGAAPPAAGRLERLDRAALKRLAPVFPWDRLLGALGAERLDAVATDDAAFLSRAGQAYEQAPFPAWKAYLRVQVIEAMAAERALPAPLVREWFRHQRRLAPAAAELRPRWKHCVESTAETFPFAAGGAFARRYLRPGGRERAAWLTAAVQRGLQSAVEAAPWIDPATQSRAAAKLDRLVTQLGYPDASPDYTALRAGRDSYFRNVISASRFAVAGEVARAVRPVDRAAWRTGPFSAEVGYAPARNVLVVPAGALQPPAYNPDAPDPVVFGATGTAIARRMAEAVQGEGRLRGPDGAPGDWWTPAAARAFEARTACLAEQYAAYAPAADQGHDARRVLPAALADLAGVRAAYEAMRTERLAHPSPETKVLGYGAEQQFFIAYAQSLCSSATDEDPGFEAVHGAAPPVRFRVNGPLANLPEFARAFRCDAGSPMVRPPAARCDVW